VGYQLLTGRLPFAAGAIVQRCVQEADPPERWCPSMPATVAAFITRAVRRQRDERFQSAAEFIVALEDAARGLNASS
jgi:serine/threonine-protein kinase